MRVRIFATPERLARALALHLARRLAAKPDIVLGLPTGATPIPLYRELVRLHHTGRAAFRRATTFNLDEFVGLEPRDPRSYHAFMERHLFDAVDLSPRRIHMFNAAPPDLARESVRHPRAIARPPAIHLPI